MCRSEVGFAFFVMVDFTLQYLYTNSTMKYLLPVAVVGIIVIATIFFFTSPKTSPESISVTPTMSNEAQTTIVPENAKYKDGTYEATGNYVSPGGPREVDISVVIDGDVVMDATFTGSSTDAPSKRFQGEFRDNFKQMVVGKRIDDLTITKVAGSSLTPIGFTDALEKIKVQAAAGA